MGVASSKANEENNLSSTTSDDEPFVFVISETTENVDSDGRKSKSWAKKTWVMPNGLRADRTVQFLEENDFQNDDTLDDYLNDAVKTSQNMVLATGSISSIGDATVEISWGNAAESKNGKPWRLCSNAPADRTLIAKPKCDSSTHRLGGRSSRETRHDAKRYFWAQNEMRAPKEAWDLLGQSLIPFTAEAKSLVNLRPPDSPPLEITDLSDAED